MSKSITLESKTGKFLSNLFSSLKVLRLEKRRISSKFEDY